MPLIFMRFRRRFRVAAPLAAVEAFHRRPESLRALTPAPLGFRFAADPPAELAPGDELSFTLWAGPVRVRWRARIEALDAAGGPGPVAGFADRQLDGPFALWVHRHRFCPLPDGGTEIDDEIEARLAPHPLWAPVGLAIWAGLPAVFAWRARRTRRLLAGSARADG